MLPACLAPRVLASSLALLLVAGCTPGTPGASGSGASIQPHGSGRPTPGLVIVRGMVSAGPVCPVERNPPDPSCADRPVAGAVLVVLDAAGTQVARATSGADGQFQVALGPGGYRLVPQPRAGLLGTAAPLAFEVREGVPPAPLAVSYDTGIR
jgi:hypothetical protein